LDSDANIYDVVILGGSLAGSSTGLLLSRRFPGCKIAVIEKSTEFGRRVGEATVEVSGFFLSRVLGLTQYLNENHLNKQGMRFWFSNDQTSQLDQCSEVGGRYLARMPAWQVDRSTLDLEVLSQAERSGVQVIRPAKVNRVRLEDSGLQTVEIETLGARRTIRARWVVDATGFTALLARQNGWFQRNAEHPTSAIWTRWKKVKDFDGLELAGRFPEWASACKGVRGTATNHFMGDGWWAWCIPLKGGETSIGVVFDHRRVEIPPGDSIPERLRTFLSQHPVPRELLAEAEPVDGDANWRSHLAYCSSRFAGDGFVLVGDAAGFLDPFYSPGMDWLSYTVSRAVELIGNHLEGQDTKPLVGRFNQDFCKSYDRWFKAIYKDKYDVFGDFELMSIAFHLDLGMYYAGVVSQPVERGERALLEPVFSTPPSQIPFRLMSFYNRRLARMARDRRRRGTAGKHNNGRRFLLNGFLPERSTGSDIFKAFTRYMKLELAEGWRSWCVQETLENTPPIRP
jgi:flavin-dependent dehydrogenase